MKRFTNIFVLVALFTIAFSWTGLFESFKAKEEDIKNKIDLKNLGLSNLKDISLKDLTNITPDIKSRLEKLKNIIPKDLDPSHHKDIDEFWTGVFEAFRLPKPAELINCFGSVSGKIFFRKIQTINNLLMHSKGHDMVKLHTDYTQFEVLMHALAHSHKCMVETKDFERLTDALHIPHDPEVLMKAKYLYYQAKFDTLAEEYKGVYNEVVNKNFNKAGKVFAEVFKKAASEYNRQGEDLLALQAFGNGLSETLGLPLPAAKVNCYNGKDAKLVMDFFKGLSHAVAEGKWYRADSSASDYWSSEGKSLLEKIDKKVLKCDMNSHDSKNLNEKLGLDLSSKEFREKMCDYTTDHNIMFYSYLRTMNSAFEKNDYLHAAAAYAHLLEAVSKSS